VRPHIAVACLGWLLVACSHPSGFERPGDVKRAAECSGSADLDVTHAECSARHPAASTAGLWQCAQARCEWQVVPLANAEVARHADGTLCLSGRAFDEVRGLEGFTVNQATSSFTFLERLTDGRTLAETGPLIVGDTVYCSGPEPADGAANGSGTGDVSETGDTATPARDAARESWQCGPDMTQRTFEVMQKIIDDYNAAPADRRAAACASLISLSTGESAWDIYPFFPGPDCANNRPGEIATTSGCCKPCWPCASSVEYFDRCINYQVLNYVFWGVSMELCNQQYRQILLRLLRSANSVHRNAQGNAQAMGRAFASATKAGVSAESRERAVRNLFEQARSTWDALDEDDCPTTCTHAWATPLQYRWRGL